MLKCRATRNRLSNSNSFYRVNALDCRKPGVTTADLQVYGQPEGVLHFSGEAACIRYNGFVHAGLLAGQKSANEVLQKLGYISVVPASWCDVSPASIPTAPKHTHKLKGYDSADDQAWLDAYDPYLNSTSASTSASSLSSESSTTPAVAGGVAAAVALAGDALRCLTSELHCCAAYTCPVHAAPEFAVLSCAQIAGRLS